MTAPLTIDRIFALEPALREIAETAAQLAMLGNNKWVLYSKAKAQVQKLVGWTARKNELRNSATYDLFIDHLCDKLSL